ncbi:unnamed protein product [Rotaria sp. Silwood2]|nr:unnamed protein product [Rotaria sp. Silwood2]
MIRYQEALKKHLLKREEKLAIQLREADNELKKIREKREALGVTLYNLQQELARHQMLLEKEHDHFGEINQDRQRIDQDLKQIKERHLKKKEEHDTQMRQTLETQKERDVLQRRLHYMNKAKNDIRGDLSTMRRATEKVDSEVTKLEADKRIQDLFVDRLVQQVDMLREQISMYEYQLKVQMEETKNIKHTLVEARLESETLELETKQLMQNWNSCLIGIRRRDEAQATMAEAVRAIPIGSDGKPKPPSKGSWITACDEFLTAVTKALGYDLPLIVEDLGYLTQEVFDLRDKYNLNGMRVLQFGFGTNGSNMYLPHNYVPNSVVYTGTHDNNTTIAWFRHNATKKEKENLIKYLQKEGDPEHNINWDLIRLVHTSVANTSIILFQDVLNLEEDCRMNHPIFTPDCEENWRWRFTWEQLTQSDKDKLQTLTQICGRFIIPEESSVQSLEEPSQKSYEERGK